MHLFFVALLVALIAGQALKKSFDASDAVLIVLAPADRDRRSRPLTRGRSPCAPS